MPCLVWNALRENLLLIMSMPQQAVGSQACFHSSRMACGLTVCIWQQPVIILEVQCRTEYTSHFTPWTVGAWKALVAIHLCQNLSPFLYKHRSGQLWEGQSCVPLLLPWPSWLLFKSETLTLVCPSLSWWLRVSPLLWCMNLLRWPVDFIVVFHSLWLCDLSCLWASM